VHGPVPLRVLVLGSSPTRVGRKMRLITSKPLGFRGSGFPLNTGTWVDFLRHDSGVRWRQGTAPDGFHQQGPDAPSAHRRPGYPLSGCVPAEPNSVSPGNVRLASTEQRGKPPSDTRVMPRKILLYRFPTENSTKLPTRFGEEPSSLFRGDVEPLGEVFSGLGNRQMLALGPQVQNVTLDTARGIETLKHVLL
jgi:hypothetical protein